MDVDVDVDFDFDFAAAGPIVVMQSHGVLHDEQPQKQSAQPFALVLAGIVTIVTIFGAIAAISFLV